MSKRQKADKSKQPSSSGPSNERRKPGGESKTFIYVLFVIGAITGIVCTQLYSAHKTEQPAAPTKDTVTANDAAHGTEPLSYPGYPKAMPGCTIKAPVEVLQWSPKKPLAAEMLKRGTPAIIKNSLAELWPARTRWTPQYLKNRVPDKITMVYKSTNPVFGPLWRPRKPMGSMSTLQWSNPHTLVNMSNYHFFKHIETPQPRALTAKELEARKKQHKATNETQPEQVLDYIYYTGDLNAPNLVKDILPHQELLLTPNRGMINIWMGQANVTAHTHLDTYDNFFVQLYGRKKFLLFAPDQQPNLYPYPFLHPAHGQCQVSIEQGYTDPQHFVHQVNATAYEADLEPGDMLYLPPMWFHYVVSVDLSISVNIWSVSKQQDLYDQMIGETIRSVDGSWEQEVKTAAAHHILTNMLDGIGKRYPVHDVLPYGTSSGWETALSPSKEFIKRLVHERFARLIDLKQLPTEFFTHANGDKTPLNVCAPVGNLAEADKQRVSAFIETLIKTFGTLPSSTRGHWLGNYVETLSYWGLGSAEPVAAFLTRCFE